MTSAESIIHQMKTKDEYLVGSMMLVYRFQTQDEQVGGKTTHLNDVGFNAADAEILSSFSKQFTRKKRLSEKQLRLARNKMQKYAGQIARNGLEVKSMPIIAGVNFNKKNHPKRVAIEGSLLVFQFPYDPQLIDNIKELPGRRWNVPKKVWTVPDSSAVRAKAVEWGFAVPWEGNGKDKIPSTKERVRKVMLTPLRDFQQEGVDFLEHREGRAIIGDDMGLGKTIQAIAWLALHPEARPVVIVCPAVVKTEWARQLQQHAGLPSVILSGTRPPQEPTPEMNSIPIWIINYDILKNWTEIFLQANLQTVIADEIQCIKTRSAKRSKAVRAICKGKVPYVMGLSGTMIENRPIEYFNGLNLIDRQRFPNFMRFAFRYCGARHNGFGWDFNGATHLEELHEVTKEVMIRRLKKDVLTELPPKQRMVIPFEIDNKREYRAAEEDLLKWLRENVGEKAAMKASQAEVLTRFAYLKRLAAKGKIGQAIKWIRDYLDTGNKLVVFACHREVVKHIHKTFEGEAVRIYGGDSMAQRDQAVNAFQNDPEIRLFVGNIKAAGIGITLTAASATCFVELGWTPAEHNQAEDRVHRIGQTADSVFAYYLIAKSTIEDTVIQILDSKRRVLDKALDGVETEEENLLAGLLSSLKR